MKKFNDKVQELLNSVLKKSSPNEENINVEDISDESYIDDVFFDENDVRIGLQTTKTRF